MKLTKHYVTFYSSGTFVAESTSQEIESWDIAQAQQLATTIRERYNAMPFGFRFTTRERADDDFDSREVARSGMYYINCNVLTADDIETRADPADDILLSNMRCNGWDRVVQTKAGWRWTQPLNTDDVVL